MVLPFVAGAAACGADGTEGARTDEAGYTLGWIDGTHNLYGGRNHDTHILEMPRSLVEVGKSRRYGSLPAHLWCIYPINLVLRMGSFVLRFWVQRGYCFGITLLLIRCAF